MAMRKYVPVGARQFVCQYCATVFVTAHKKRFCSAKCRSVSYDRALGVLSAVDRNAQRLSIAKWRFTCEHCGKEARKEIGGKNRKEGYKRRWCSMACKVSASDVARRECAMEKRRTKLLKRVYRLLVLVLRGKLTEAEPPRSHNTPAKCKRCGVVFDRPKGTNGRPKAFCSRRCTRKYGHKKNRPRYRKLHGNQSTHRARARKAGVSYEPVSRQRVFDRDGWRCQVCGKATPPTRIGTQHANAPELDHRVPLAMGGPHSYANVQCTCRACNHAKGGKIILGQLPLYIQGDRAGRDLGAKLL